MIHGTAISTIYEPRVHFFKCGCESLEPKEERKNEPRDLNWTGQARPLCLFECAYWPYMHTYIYIYVQKQNLHIYIYICAHRAQVCHWWQVCRETVLMMTTREISPQSGGDLKSEGSGSNHCHRCEKKKANQCRLLAAPAAPSSGSQQSLPIASWVMKDF